MTLAERTVDKILEMAGRKKKAKATVVPPPAAQPPATPEMSPEEMGDFVVQSLDMGGLLRLLDYSKRFDISVSGDVRRTEHHYVHQRSTSFTLNIEFYDHEKLTPEVEAWVDANANAIEEEIYEKIVDINNKIYRALEREWDYRLSDEAVDQDIQANWVETGQMWDEDGDQGGDLTWDQLNDHAKNRVREKWREGEYQSGDNSWSEQVIEEWIDELAKMGFGYGTHDQWKDRQQVSHADPEISWSGFSSQGDGASFTTSHFDFEKYVNYFMTGQDKEPGPMTWGDKPMNESEDPAENVDAEIEQMIRDVAFIDYRQVAEEDPYHQPHGNVESHVYNANHTTDDGRLWARMRLYVTNRKDGADRVKIHFDAHAFDLSTPGQRLRAGDVTRDHSFFVPAGKRGEFLSRLYNWWESVKNFDIGPVPQERMGSLGYSLSRFAGQWKKENSELTRTHIQADVNKMIQDDPDSFAQAQKRLQIANQKREMRDQMRQWARERGIRYDESVNENDEEMLRHISQTTLADSFPWTAHMDTITNRYWNGMQQYNWKRNNNWFIVNLYVTIADLKLDQNWSLDLRVKDMETTRNWTLDLHFASLEEKSNLGPQVKLLIERLEPVIAEARFPERMSTERRCEDFLNSLAGIVNQTFRTFATFEEI